MAVITYNDFVEAKAVADEEDLGIGGVHVDGKPVYFLHPRNATDSELRRLAFEAFNGRPMNEAETRLTDLVLARAPEKLEASEADL